MIMDVVGVHLREQHGIDQHRDKNAQDEQVISRSRLIARVHKQYL